jgi:hypothetical protein
VTNLAVGTNSEWFQWDITSQAFLPTTCNRPIRRVGTSATAMKEYMKPFAAAGSQIRRFDQMISAILSLEEYGLVIA